jgi:predicted glycosyltransferase involved in capsule biosynthesis
MEPYAPIVADDGSEPFSRSGSKNLGASVSDSDIVMFLDADTWIPHSQIDEAFELARQGYMVTPFKQYHYFDSHHSREAFNTGVVDYKNSVASIDWATGGAIVMSKEMFFDYGAYDEEFVDWGFEDAALLIVRQRAGIERKNVEGPCVHFWHPRQYNEQNVSKNEQKFIREYRDAD